jgi:ATP-dependent Clp protease protease subunit
MNKDEFDLDQIFLESRRILLWGEIKEESAKTVIQSMRYLADISKEDIYLYIHSDGGDTEAQDAIIDEMEGTRARGITIWTVAQGKAYSAAANILALGEPGHRFATKNSTLMLHMYSVDMPTDYVHMQKIYAEFTGKKNDEIYRQVAKACQKGTGKKLESFMNDLKSGLWLNARSAKSYGLIDGIWDYKWENALQENIVKSQMKNSDNI